MLASQPRQLSRTDVQVAEISEQTCNTLSHTYSLAGNDSFRRELLTAVTNLSNALRVGRELDLRRGHDFKDDKSRRSSMAALHDSHLATAEAFLAVSRVLRRLDCGHYLSDMTTQMVYKQLQNLCS
jgi:Flp pilus assembly secretin CpaC